MRAGPQAGAADYASRRTDAGEQPAYAVLDMKTQTQRTEDLRRGRLAADLEARVGALFRRCPTLCGFSVRGSDGLARDGIEVDSASELYVTEVSVYPLSGLEAPREICREIAKALVQLIDERPEASGLLRERAFARTFH
jgi:hypothetical protein